MDLKEKELGTLQMERVAYQAHRKLLERFVAMARTPGSVEMMKKTLKKSVEVAAAITGAEKGSLFLLDDHGVVTDSILTRGEREPEERFQILGSVLKEGLAGWVSRHRRVGLIRDANTDERWLTLPDQPYAVGSALAVPIMRGGDLFGILTLLHSKQGHFTEEKADLMQVTANQMGLALENVRLYEKLEDSYRSLEEAKKAAEAYSKALDEELEKGRKIQRDFLPGNLPDVPDWEFEACFLPAAHVAGDFYDVFQLPGNYMGFVIADVCDKGVGSALYMALFRSLLRIFSGQTRLSGLSIAVDNGSALQARALRAIPLTNHYLLENHGRMGMFATIFFGVLDPANGELAYINAGHLAPFILGRDGIRKHLTATGPFVGLMLPASYRIETVQIEPGEALIGFTDGVTEATSVDGEFFTEKRLEKAAAGAGPSAKEIVLRVQTELSKYTGKVPQNDDITLLVVKRKNREEREEGMQRK